MQNLIQLADYGPIGFMLLSVLVTVKIFLDHYKEKETRGKLGSMTEKMLSSNSKKLDLILEKQAHIASMNEEMIKWHEREDTDGVKIWYRKPSDDKKFLHALEKVSIDIGVIAKSLNKLSYDMQSVKEKIDE